MKLWLLTAREGFAYGYDVYDGFVIEAKSARAARALAAKNGGDEQDHWPTRFVRGSKTVGGWLDSKCATCKELKPRRLDKDAEIILSGFNAG